MPQCKKDMCREPAVHNRRWGNKRYCETHGHAYADKRDIALKARALMPDCESRISSSCMGKVGVSSQESGKVICRFCEEEILEMEAQARHEEKKWSEFRDASSVEQLKEWIMEYMT